MSSLDVCLDVYNDFDIKRDKKLQKELLGRKAVIFDRHHWAARLVIITRELLEEQDEYESICVLP